MKKILVSALFFGLAVLASGAYYWEHEGNYPGTVILASNAPLYNSFFVSVGNTYYTEWGEGNNEITVYNTEFGILEQFAFLDAHFPVPSVNARSSGVLVSYIGDESDLRAVFDWQDERPWGEFYQGDIRFWKVDLMPLGASGHLMEFAYVPEPSTLLLLGLGGLAVRMRKR